MPTDLLQDVAANAATEKRQARAALQEIVLRCDNPLPEDTYTLPQILRTLNLTTDDVARMFSATLAYRQAAPVVADKPRRQQVYAKESERHFLFERAAKKRAEAIDEQINQSGRRRDGAFGDFSVCDQAEMTVAGFRHDYPELAAVVDQTVEPAVTVLDTRPRKPFHLTPVRIAAALTFDADAPEALAEVPEVAEWPTVLPAAAPAPAVATQNKPVVQTGRKSR